MANLLDAIDTLITTETTKYVGSFPETATDNICTLYDIGGRAPEHTLGQKKAAYRQPGFQVRIRDKSYTAAYNRCQSIISSLDGLTNQTITGGKIVQILLEGDIMSLGRDKKDRIELTMNFSTIVQWS